MRVMLLLLVLCGCLGATDEGGDGGCTPDACADLCVADGYDGGACISAPPAGPAECACR
jgi:hypothetical protein